MAKKTAGPTVNNNEFLPFLEQRVPVTIAEDEIGDNMPVYLQNGTETCLIERGKTVLVKRKFALQLEERTREMKKMKALFKQMENDLNSASKQTEK